MKPLALPSLAELEPDAADHGQRVERHLRETLVQAGGWLPFSTWMAQALYAPGLGYYAAGAHKLGVDFTTAPELSPLFGATLARSVAAVLRESVNPEHSPSPAILEFGAGTGALAESVLDALDALGIDASYDILEVSADLRERQQQRLARFAGCVRWLDALPHAFTGCVLANEVMDAMPATLFCWSDDGRVLERGVSLRDERFVWEDRTASAELDAAVRSRMPALPGYVSEINLQAEAWVTQMGQWLTRGAALLVDYGFPQAEYYHPQRAGGTVMCHFRRLAHGDPLVLAGLQDITAHVDFTALADAALAGGLDVLGYTSQQRFLIEAGLPALLGSLDPTDAVTYAKTVGPVQTLVSEAEMGELFKVLCIGRGLDHAPVGFGRGDRRHRL